MIQIYNSSNKSKEVFSSLNENEVRIYVCGPTVYDYSHLGHARSAITFDLFNRIFELNNLNVKFIKNFTDIDDKILNKMKSENKSLNEITEKFIFEYKKDMNLLNIKDVIEIKATDNIDNMINFIDKLIKQGNAYKLKDGIYFDTNSINNYGSLFNKLSEDNRREIEKNILKKNEKDFVLWKFDLESPIVYETPFGKGRPGWHTECSVMINEHLAYKDKEYQIDIHGGGSDLMFPHHENENAQTLAYSGKELSKYWIHNGFVTINGTKMSKSLGNSFYLKDILKQYNPEVVRMYLISNHYRSNFDFNEVDLIASKKRLDKLYRIKKETFNIDEINYDNIYYKNILKALNDDLNTNEVMLILDIFITYANNNINNKKEIGKIINSFDSIIGIGYQNPFKYFQFGIDNNFINNIENKINERLIAKKNKDYTLADSIRNELNELNVNLMDTKDNTFWEIKDLEYDFKEMTFK